MPTECPVKRQGTLVGTNWQGRRPTEQEGWNRRSCADLTLAPEWTTLKSWRAKLAAAPTTRWPPPPPPSNLARIYTATGVPTKMQCSVNRSGAQGAVGEVGRFLAYVWPNRWIGHTAAAGAARAGMQYQTGSGSRGACGRPLGAPESPHTSSSRRLGSSTISLMRFRKVTASRPSISLQKGGGGRDSGREAVGRVGSGSVEAQRALGAGQRACSHATAGPSRSSLHASQGSTVSTGPAGAPPRAPCLTCGRK